MGAESHCAHYHDRLNKVKPFNKNILLEFLVDLESRSARIFFFKYNYKCSIAIEINVSTHSELEQLLKFINVILNFWRGIINRAQAYVKEGIGEWV